METVNPIQEEERKMRLLRVIVDLTAAVLAQERLSIDEALDLVNGTRRTVLRLFPGKEETYHIIYGRRFERILRDRFGPPRRGEEQAHPTSA
ncbi:MAG: hypothetical protein C4532_04480 [Candidatus Abyssobacteria bacterium SURF_17]|uniref:Uncharacterized protein n=1 Tax=Candidatus Abyssobacteria bacterium SURF_17 TaxID=2093361 RepID=A0A419F4Q7_9BACT|nr:MAG: hypothetical protein C4532_04480 [Candidatus Abyssubacteria bacterium SURF_17]